MVTAELTAPMRQVLAFLAQRKAERALTPKAAEIAVALDLPRDQIQSLITELVELELLEFNPRFPRSLTLTPAAEHLATTFAAPCPAANFC